MKPMHTTTTSNLHDPKRDASIPADEAAMDGARRRRNRTTASLLAAAGLFMLGSLAFLSAAAMLAPTKPAVCAAVDLEKVYGALHEQAAADADLDAIATKMNDEAEKQRKALEDLKTDLDSYKAGTAAYKDAMGKLELSLYQYNALVEFNRQKIEARRAEYIRAIYVRIKDALKTLAEEHHWDIVFLDDSVPALEPSDAQRTMQQISARRMLYCSDELDVTEILVAKLNADFLARGGKPATPKPKPPAGASGAASGAAKPSGGSGN